MATPKYDTPYIESEIVLAATCDDVEFIKEKAKELSEGELRSIERALNLASETLAQERRKKYP